MKLLCFRQEQDREMKMYREVYSRHKDFLQACVGNEFELVYISFFVETDPSLYNPTFYLLSVCGLDNIVCKKQLIVTYCRAIAILWFEMMSFN